MRGEWGKGVITRFERNDVNPHGVALVSYPAMFYAINVIIINNIVIVMIIIIIISEWPVSNFDFLLTKSDEEWGGA